METNQNVHPWMDSWIDKRKSMHSTQASQVAPVVKNLPANTGDVGDAGSIPGLGICPGGGRGNPPFLPGESHGWRSLVGYGPWGHRESYTTKHACMHHSLESGSTIKMNERLIHPTRQLSFASVTLS